MTPKAAVLVKPVARVVAEVREILENRKNKRSKRGKYRPKNLALGISMRARHADPVQHKIIIDRLQANRGRKPKGLPQYSMLSPEQRAEKFAKAKKDTVKIMEQLKAEGLVSDDKRAEAAMAVAVEIMLSPILVRDRLQAARTVLEYTKQKPSTKGEEGVVGAAEKFLSALAAKA